MATRSLPCPSCQAVIEIDSGPQNESPRCPRCGSNVVLPVQTGDSSVVEIFPALTPTWRPDQPSPTPLGRHADGGHVVIHNHRQRHSVQGLKVTVIVATCVSGGIGLILTAVFGSRESEVTASVMASIGGLFLLLAIGGGIAWGMGVKKSCPSCSHWWTPRLRETKLVRKEMAFKKITRQDRHSTSGVSFGSSGLHYRQDSKTTERDEQVRVLRSQFDNFYECDACGHRWVVKSHTETEDFSDSEAGGE